MARYRLKSGKLHTRINGKRVIFHKGDIINLESWQAKGFKNTLELLDPEPPDSPPPQPEAGLKAIHKGGGRYDVVNEKTGVKINDRLLSRDEAQALVEAPMMADENLNEDDEGQPAGGA